MLRSGTCSEYACGVEVVVLQGINNVHVYIIYDQDI